MFGKLFGKKPTEEVSKEPTEEPTETYSKDYKVDAPKRITEREHYRVGFTTDGNITLTLIADYNNVTLTMNREYCERLIRMLRATYPQEHGEE